MNSTSTEVAPGRLAFLIEYDGRRYCGWQSQSHDAGKPSVQDAVSSALSKVASGAMACVAAGRTDAGVHATAQIIHADSPVARPLSAWTRGVNSFLPPDVSCLWASPVPREFHARYSAMARHYVYWLENRSARSGLWTGRMGWHHRPLDADAMAEAAKRLLGEHDFSSFRAAECQAKTPVKTLTRAEVTRRGDLIRFSFSGNAFLHHMVRNIVGSLIFVGRGKKPVEWMSELLEAKDRRLAAPTFPPDGLYLTGVDYDAKWGLPGTRRESC